MSDKIDWKFIAAREGAAISVGYVPMRNGKVFGVSGVTIATGFDLGQRNEYDLKKLKLSTALSDKLKPYLIKKKEEAVKFLEAHPLTITKNEAQEIDLAVKKLEVPLLKTRYDTSPYNKGKIGANKKITKLTFDHLPSQAQTVIASMSFQWGNLSRTETLEFWKLVCVQNWAEAVGWLKKQNQYPGRRKLEAGLLEQLIKRNEKAASLLPNISIWQCVLIFAFLCSVKIVGFAQAAPTIFDSKIIESYENYDASLKEKLSPLNFDSGKSVVSCKEYLEEKTRSKISETVADSIFHSEYVNCDIIFLLKQSNESDQLIFRKTAKFNYGREILTRLNLNSFPCSFRDEKRLKLPKNIRSGAYWKPKVSNLNISSNAEMWFFEITVIAEIDADNDGRKDLILTIIEQALKEGNYRSYQTLLISDYKKKGELNARQI